MSKQNRPLKCAVEALEDRQLLTVSTSLTGGGTILRITGDSSSEQLTITQNEVNDQIMVSWNPMSNTPQGDSVTPQGDPVPAQVFQGSTIKKIVVRLGGGDDHLTYVLNGNQLQAAKAINVDLGAGNDSAFFDFGGNLLTPVQFSGSIDTDGDGVVEHQASMQMSMPAELSANLTIDVRGGAGDDSVDAVFGNISRGVTYRTLGGAGNDSLSARVGGFVDPTGIVKLKQDGGAGNDQLWVDLGNRGIAKHAQVEVTQRGGAGKDTLTINARLPLYAPLTLNQFGGAGDDKISTFVLADWQSTGSVMAQIHGEGGEDEMTMRIKREEAPADVSFMVPMRAMKVNGLVDGGNGPNLAWVTPNVVTFMTVLKDRSWDFS